MYYYLFPDGNLQSCNMELHWDDIDVKEISEEEFNRRWDELMKAREAEKENEVIGQEDNIV